MRIVICSLLLFHCCTSLNAQHYNQQMIFLKANSVWLFGQRFGLDFNNFSGGNPTFVQSQMSFPAVQSSASVADTVTGNLLFYTDGKKIWDANHQVMPNGSSLLNYVGPPSIPVAWATSQGVCIVPAIGDPDKYYVFCLQPTTRGLPLTSAGSLCYSVVDMTLNGGMGDVIPWQKNIPLYNDSLPWGAVIAIPGNNCDVWLVTHKQRHPEFLAYHITAQGVNPTPVVSVAGDRIYGNSSFLFPCYSSPVNTVAYNEVSLAVSPNREYIAMTSGATGFLSGFGVSDQLAGLILCKFNPATGVVSEGVRVTHSLPLNYKPDYALQLMANVPAFSPDNSKLYVSLAISNTDTNCPNPVYTNNYSIVQYDVGTYDSLAIANSAVTIYDFFSSEMGFLTQYLKLYNDSIYVYTSRTNSHMMHQINKPNEPGLACDFQYNAMSFPRNNVSGKNLPSEVVYPLPPDTLFNMILDTIICVKNGTGFRSFRLSAEEGYSGYEWDNGSDSRQRVINSPGTYWVISKDACHSRVDTFRFRYVDLLFSLGNDTAICNGEPLIVTLNGLPFGTSFNWQDNSSGNTYTVNQSGKYWVEVVYEGCTLADTINVVLTDVQQYLGEDTAICNDQPIQLTLHANVPQRATALWNTGVTSASIPVSDAGIYWVQVSEPPCTGSDSISIYYELCNCFVQMPNAFSPNGDGINDIFLPYIEPDCLVEQFNLNIYNRYGQRVYSGYSSSNGWDGRHNGVLADVGTYFFEVAFIAGTKGEKFYKKGDLILIR